MDEYWDSLAPTIEPRRPNVQRASTAPKSLEADTLSPLSAASFGYDRPILPRACSESRATGVLERRRRKGVSLDGSLPHLMVLDFANIPKAFGTTNPSLIKAARRAAQEPREWDWGFAVASGSTNARREAEEKKRPVKQMSYFEFTMATKGACAKERTCNTFAPQRKPNRQEGCLPCQPWYAYDTEWDWALGGNSRISNEMYRSERAQHGCNHESTTDLCRYQLRNWMASSPAPAESPNAEEVYLAMQAKFASFLPEPKRLKARLKTLRVQSQKFFSSHHHHHHHHQHKTSMHLPTAEVAVESSLAQLQLGSCPFFGARENALRVRRSRSMERFNAIS